ncbi:MAG: hypothetical protein ACK55Z_23600, partial [bacterium]
WGPQVALYLVTLIWVMVAALRSTHTNVSFYKKVIWDEGNLLWSQFSKHKILTACDLGIGQMGVRRLFPLVQLCFYYKLHLIIFCSILDIAPKLQG